MDFTLRQLEIFRAVVVSGSITKASRGIDLSQPSISQQLAKLEDNLGVQLINRSRSGSVSLTPAGEFWYRAAVELIERAEAVIEEHDHSYRTSNLELKFGVTPSVRGRLLSAATRIAVENGAFSRVKIAYELNSGLLVDQLCMHRVDMTVVSAEVLEGDLPSLATEKLWHDDFLWVVPAKVSDAELCAAISGDTSRPLHPQLAHYIEPDPSIRSRAATRQWYKNHLPGAAPTYLSPTFAAGVELVADGLGTTNIVRSLVPSLSDYVLRNVKLFRIDGFERTAVLAMRNHLLSHPNFRRTFHDIVEFCRTDFAPAMQCREIREISEIMEPVC